MEAKLYNQKGKSTKSVKLPEEIFGLTWNGDLVHQVVVAMQANARTPVAHAKDRSDVSGGGRKPWKQKGTGRARHGSNRSPIWAGGGVTHGPLKEKSYKKKINQKMKTKALYTILAEKFRNGEVAFVDKIELDEVKTKTALDIFTSLGVIPGLEDMKNKKNNTLYLSVLEKEEIMEKSFNNIGNILVSEIKKINLLDLLKYKYLIIANPEISFDFILSKTKTN